MGEGMKFFIAFFFTGKVGKESYVSVFLSLNHLHLMKILILNCNCNCISNFIETISY